MSNQINDVIEKLSGFMFGYSTGIWYMLKHNLPLPDGIEVTPIADFNVYSRVMKYDEETHVVFQLGKQCVQVDVDSFIAKNVISLVIGPNSKIISTKTAGKSIPVSLNEVSVETFKDAVILFKDEFISGIE